MPGGDTRLSVIAEDGNVHPPPPIPPRAAHRPFAKRFHLGDPPRHSYEKSPPPYSIWTNVVGPKGEHLADVRWNKRNSRGGWRRLCLVTVAVVVVVAGLIVGLVIGLQKSQNRGNIPLTSSSSPPPSGPAPNGPFPAGSYSLTTFLDAESDNCTSNGDTWRCFPYATYEDSPDKSKAIFHWIITAAQPKSSSPPTYSISSTNNPFALDFSNVPLRLVDAGLSSERYTFSMLTNKVVIPFAAITIDNSLATCYYNRTSFRADLYTKMRRMYPAEVSASSSAPPPSSTEGTGNSSTNTGFQPWPYAVRIEEYIGGGADVPACYRTTNGNIGDRVIGGLTPEAAEEKCNCLYMNYGR